MTLPRYTFGSIVRRGFVPGADATANVRVTVSGQTPFDHAVPMLTAGDVVGIPARQVIRSYPHAGVSNAEPNFLAAVEFDSPDIPWILSRPTPDGRTHPWVMLAVVDETDLDDDPLSSSPAGTQLTVDSAQLPDPAEAWLWAHVQLLGDDAVPDDPTRSLARLLAPRRLRPDRRYLACVVPTLASARVAGLGDDPGPLRTSADWAWGAGQGTVTLPVYHWFRFATGPSGDFEALVRRLHGVPLPSGMGRRRVRLDHPLAGLPAPLPGGADLELHVALRPPGEVTDPIAPLVGQGYLDVLKSRLADAGYDVSLLTNDPAAPPPQVGPPVYGQLPVGSTATAATLGTAAVPPWLSELNLDPRLRIAAGLGTAVVQADQDHYLESAWRQVNDVLAANRLRRRADYSLATSRRLYRRWIERLDDGALLTATAPVHARIRVGPGETVVGRLRDSPLPPAIVSVEFRRFSRERGALAHATAWQATADVPVLASRSGEARPLVQRVPLDSIETLAAPSTIWDGAASVRILGRLVTDVGPVDGATATAQLDAVSALSSFVIPPPAEVAAAVANRPSPDVVLSAAGFLPVAVVGHPTEPPHVPPTEPPIELPGSHRRRHPPFYLRVPQMVAGRVRGAIGAIARRFGGGPVDTVAVGAGRDLQGIEPDLLRATPSTQVIGALRQDPSLVSVAGDQVSLDLERLTLATRTGPAATMIDRAILDEAIAGSWQSPAPEVRPFAVPVDRRGALDDELGLVAIGISERAIRPGDAADPPGRALAGGLGSLRATVLTALDPGTTLLRAVNSRIAALRDEERAGFRDIMAAPDLSEPTYGALARISHDWLLPGIDQLPTDTTTLVAANRQFINAFLVGMNHELGRELLWHEYPTDQRGTYARQFWMHRPTGVREDEFDLRHELHAAPTRLLAGLTSDGEDPLVVVVKGELIRRYPGLIIVAARTRPGPGGRRVYDETRVEQPGFVGVLEPDVALVGFDNLTESIVRSAADQPDEAWWIFFAEHFAEPRFGFDELVVDGVELGPDDHVAWAGPTSWNDAAWQYATLSAGGFLTAASFSQTLAKGQAGNAEGQHAWASTAAAQAWITLQFPFRRGIRAIDLLPPKVTP